MTCIVAVTDGKKVTIGGDSAGTGGWSQAIRKDPKVFRLGNVVMGFTSSFRMGQLLNFNLHVPKVPKNEEDLYPWAVTELIPQIRHTLKDGGYAETKNGVETGGNFLVGVKGQIFQVESDYQVGMVYDDYMAVGCGEDLAMGSLFSTKGQSTKKRIKLALDAASYHSAGVAGPYVILSNKGKK